MSGVPGTCISCRVVDDNKTGHLSQQLHAVNSIDGALRKMGSWRRIVCCSTVLSVWIIT